MCSFTTRGSEPLTDEEISVQKIRIFLGYTIGALLTSPGLYVIFGFFWALLTPIDVERVATTPDPLIFHSIHVQERGITLEFKQPFWTMSGTGWSIRMERRATCPVAQGISEASCFRYGTPVFEADFVKMLYHWREEERLRRMLEEEALRSTLRT
jgi:hypothetical protein